MKRRGICQFPVYSAWDNNRPAPLGLGGGDGQTLLEEVMGGVGNFEVSDQKQIAFGHLDENGQT